MARKTEIVFYDDLTGEVVPDSDVAQIKFTVSGETYLLEGTEDTIEQFKVAVAPFTAAASPLTGRKVKSGRVRTTTSQDLRRIRSWASENGYAVAPKGRIPVRVVEAYNSATL